MTARTRPTIPATDLADTLIRDLVNAYPEVMPVLAPYGLDLCCGGGHPLGEALDLHGAPKEHVIAEVAKVIERSAQRA